jgi:hypothetical protein
MTLEVLHVRLFPSVNENILIIITLYYFNFLIYLCSNLNQMITCNNHTRMTAGARTYCSREDSMLRFRLEIL